MYWRETFCQIEVTTLKNSFLKSLLEISNFPWETRQQIVIITFCVVLPYLIPTILKKSCCLWCLHWKFSVYRTTVNTVLHLRPSLTSMNRGASPCLHSLNSIWYFWWTFILDGLFWKPKLRKKKKFVISGSDTEFRSVWVWIFPHSYIFHWVATTRNAKWDGSLFQKYHIISSSHHPLYLHLIFLRVFTVARHSK